jgi:hypothetical protein
MQPRATSLEHFENIEKLAFTSALTQSAGKKAYIAGNRHMPKSGSSTGRVAPLSAPKIEAQ